MDKKDFKTWTMAPITLQKAAAGDYKYNREVDTISSSYIKGLIQFPDLPNRPFKLFTGNIKENTFYKTRSGVLAYITHISIGTDSIYPAIGRVLHDTFDTSWKADGTWTSNIHPKDLVEIQEEEKSNLPAIITDIFDGHCSD